MKILIDGRLYGLENAGLGRYLINLIDQIGKLDTKNEYVLFLRKKYFNSLNLPENWKKVLVDIGHYTFAEQIRLPGLINKEKPDLVHFPHFNAPVFYHGKYVVTVHDMLMHKSIGLDATTLPAPLYFLKRLGYKLVFDNAIKYSTKTITPSRTVKEELLEYYKVPENKIHVTYEGVDAKISSNESSKTTKPYFVYAGNAYPHKNLKRLIEAVVLLNKNCNHLVKLVIASSRGIFTQRLEKIIQDQKAGNFMELIGFVPDDKLFTLYKNSIGFIFPSLSEGFGLPGLEAMASGTLVLASNIPVFREIYQNHPIYFDPKNLNSIKSAMENAINMNLKLRKEKIDKAGDFVKRYSWAKMADETIKIYEYCNSLRQSQ